MFKMFVAAPDGFRDGRVPRLHRGRVPRRRASRRAGDLGTKSVGVDRRAVRARRFIKRGKHVCSFVIAPSGIDSETALETVVEIRAQYEQMRFGENGGGRVSKKTTASRDDENAKAFSRSVFSTDEKTPAKIDASEDVFAYDPVTNGSFDAALARLVSVARASTHTGPFLAYLAGPSAVVSSSAEDDTTSRLATYAARARRGTRRRRRRRNPRGFRFRGTSARPAGPPAVHAGVRARARDERVPRRRQAREKKHESAESER